jgi:hypothetical protein
VSGFAVVAALLALQQTAETPDSSKAREYIRVGGAEMAGVYNVLSRSGTRLTLRHQHNQRMSGVSAGWHRETSTWSVGVRGQFFAGSDVAMPFEVVSGFLGSAEKGVQVTTPLSGGAAMLDLDGQHFGVSGGVVAGTLVKRKGDHTETFPSPVGAAALRFGDLSEFYGELAILDHDPAPLPGSQVKFSANFVDDRGSRYRVGFADGAPFGECRIQVKHGFEVSPFFAGGQNGGFNFSLSAAWRFSLKR